MNLPLLNKIKGHPEVETYLKKADEYLNAIGYTEHGERHADLVAMRACHILKELGYNKKSAQIAACAGYLHDIGNVSSRGHHSQVGACLVLPILRELNLPPEEIALIVSAIGNHEEEDEGKAVNEVSAAVIIADKSDVHRSRVRNPSMVSFDIHDRVNYAAKEASLEIDRKEKTIFLKLTIDTEISSVVEYFEIFLERMLSSRHAAKFLGCTFGLYINKTKLL